jgi:Spy/CpxP family protein refolding chaperone
MKKIQCFLLSITIMGLAIAASAQQNPANAIGDRFFPALGRILTDNQRDSLRQMMISQRAQFAPLDQQLRASRQAMLNLAASGKFDENAVRQYAEQSAQAESELTVMFVKMLSQMQPPLSAAQIKQLQNFQPARFRDFTDASGPPPESHMKLPAMLPRDTNDLPVVQ